MSIELASQKKKISELENSSTLNDTDLFIVSQQTSSESNISVSKKMSFATIKQKINDIINSFRYVKAKQDNNSTSVTISGGKEFENTGAKIVLTGKDSTEHGLLFLDASDGTNDARLSLRPNGQLYLYDDENKTLTHIVRSVNNLSADERGNITLEIPNNVESANKWTTARTITLTGDATGSISIDGSSNKQLSVIVKDDSHNHVISNVDGLQAALDGKFTKTGGTINGAVTYNTSAVMSRTTNDTFITLCGGKGYEEGARIVAYGKESKQKGLVYLEAHDGKNRNVLNVFADGRADINGKHIVRSVSGISADNNGDVLLKDLMIYPTSGAEGGQIILKGDTGFKNINVDNQNNCFRVWLEGTSPMLVLNPTANSMTWDGKNIVRSINGATADDNGNIPLSRISGIERVVASNFGDNSFYIKYSSGLIIQGGRYVPTNWHHDTITLPLAFSNDKYIVMLTPRKYEDGTGDSWDVSTNKTRTNSSFTFACNQKYGESVEWIAIGK